MVKAEAIAKDEMGDYEWSQVKEAITAKVKDFDPKTLTNVLVLSTVARGTERGKGVTGDLFDSVETEVILKMKAMSLPDLLNLMWSA